MQILDWVKFQISPVDYFLASATSTRTCYIAASSAQMYRSPFAIIALGVPTTS